MGDIPDLQKKVLKWLRDLDQPLRQDKETSLFELYVEWVDALEGLVARGLVDRTENNKLRKWELSEKGHEAVNSDC